MDAASPCGVTAPDRTAETAGSAPNHLPCASAAHTDTIIAPAAIRGSSRSLASPSFAAFSSAAAIPDDPRAGEGARTLPSSSATIMASTGPPPCPPWASGSEMPPAPICSHRAVHRSRSNPSADDMAARTADGGHFLDSIVRSASASIC